MVGLGGSVCGGECPSIGWIPQAFVSFRNAATWTLTQGLTTVL